LYRHFLSRSSIAEGCKTDIEYATSLAEAQDLSTLQFRVMDATQPLDFPDSTFDLVNGRILMGFLSKERNDKLTILTSKSVVKLLSISIDGHFAMSVESDMPLTVDTPR
jgi:hypothetical protein